MISNSASSREHIPTFCDQRKCQLSLSPPLIQRNKTYYSFLDPANIYFFKVNNRRPEEGVKYVQS